MCSTLQVAGKELEVEDLKGRMHSDAERRLKVGMTTRVASGEKLGLPARTIWTQVLHTASARQYNHLMCAMPSQEREAMLADWQAKLEAQSAQVG